MVRRVPENGAEATPDIKAIVDAAAAEVLASLRAESEGVSQSAPIASSEEMRREPTSHPEAETNPDIKAIDAQEKVHPFHPDGPEWRKRAAEASRFLSPGETAWFEGNSTAAAFKRNGVVRVGGSYYFLLPDGTQQDQPHTEKQIRELAEREKWRKVDGPAAILAPLAPEEGAAEESGKAPDTNREVSAETESRERKLSAKNEAILFEVGAVMQTKREMIIVQLKGAQSRGSLEWISTRNTEGGFLDDTPAFFVDAQGEILPSLLAVYTEDGRKALSPALMERLKKLAAEHQEAVAEVFRAKAREIYAQPDVLPTGQRDLSKEGKDKQILPKDGEIAEYRTDVEGFPIVRLKREGDIYYFIDDAGKPESHERYSEKEVQALLERNGWPRIGGATVDFDLTQSEAKDTHFLADGGKAEYVDVNGTRVLVERKGNLYRVTYGYLKNSSDFLIDEETVRAMAGKEGWLPKAERKRKPAQKAPKGPENNPDQSQNSKGELEKKIVVLRDELATEREAYVHKLEEQREAEKGLKKIFRNIGLGKNAEAEVAEYRKWYEAKLVALQGAELELLKTSGLKGQELREAMAGLIREYAFEEAERLDDAQREARLSKTEKPFLEKIKTLWEETKVIVSPEGEPEVTWRDWWAMAGGTAKALGEGAIQVGKKVGTEYNKVARGKYGKYLLAATIGVGVAGTLAGGGVIGGTAAGALVLKRLVGGIGVGMSIDIGAGKYARSRREKKVSEKNEEVKALLDEATGSSPEDKLAYDNIFAIAEGKEPSKEAAPDLKAFEKFLLAETVTKGRSKEKARRRGELYRKSGAIFAGAVLGSGATAWIVEHFSGSAHAAEVNRGEGVPLAPEGAVSAPIGETTASPDRMSVPSVPPPAETGGGAGESVAPPKGEGGADVSALLAPREIQRGDTLWGMAREMMGEDQRTGDRLAKLLEERLRVKLDNITPEMARAAGFSPDADGHFSPDRIEAGRTLDLGSIISKEEMQHLLEEAQSDEPIHVTAPVDKVVATVNIPDPAMVAEKAAVLQDMAHPSISPAERAEIVGEFGAGSPAIDPATGRFAVVEAVSEKVSVAELLGPKGNTLEYIKGLPQPEQEKLFRSFRAFTTEIFRTSDVMDSDRYQMQYDMAVHPELIKANVGVVLSDHTTLKENAIYFYDRVQNPLHWSQMEEVSKFAKAAAKTFGAEIAKAKATENIQEYMLRMAALAAHEGKSIPGFRVVN